MFFFGHLHTDAQVQDEQLEFIYNDSMQAQEVAWKIYRKQWMIES